MPRTIRLCRLRLTYGQGLVLHTATSGAISALDELRLTVTEDGAVAALGATRLNIAYLSGIAPDALTALCLEAVRAVDWRQDWAAMMPALDDARPDLPAPARMLIEMAAADGAARAAGQPLAVWLGGEAAPRVATNQTLFHSDDTTLLRRAEAYVTRGFTDLKLRVGLGPMAEDTRRLALLRERFGEGVRLSVDANGSWDAETARAAIAAFAAFGLRYVEQPLPSDDWEGAIALAAWSPVPIMLDESLSSMAAVERLIACGAPMLAHLKLAKLGGLDRLMAAGRRLMAAGIGVMVGQMNEGVVSTLAAAHAALALRAPYAELYGADGLEHDPAGGLTYAAGALALPEGAGLGVSAEAPENTVLWERNL
jgi:L-alanine-DL-glutamate epimerase-like enolase superfamily enzyme